MSDARDCQHGSLARSCPICELEAEVKRLKAALWQCPDCAFAFDAAHHADGKPGEYTCPACAEARLEAALKRCHALLDIARVYVSEKDFPTFQADVMAELSPCDEGERPRVEKA